MAVDALVAEVKKGLGIPLAVTAHDDTLNIKVRAVKSYLTGAGVSEAMLADDLGIAAVVVGTNDLWNLAPGEIKFSPAFVWMVEQLALRSLE